MKTQAYALQNPNKKTGICPVIIGNKRTGKNTITNILAQLYGRFGAPNVE